MGPGKKKSGPLVACIYVRAKHQKRPAAAAAASAHAESNAVAESESQQHRIRSRNRSMSPASTIKEELSLKDISMLRGNPEDPGNALHDSRSNVKREKY